MKRQVWKGIKIIIHYTSLWKDRAKKDGGFSRNYLYLVYSFFMRQIPVCEIFR